MATADGLELFGALYTVMDSRYIRAQAFTFTKAHDERIGPLMGIRRSSDKFGHPDPPVAFTDDPLKVFLLFPFRCCDH